MKKIEIIIQTLIILIIFLLGFFMIYSITNNTCKTTYEAPFRYQETGGLFGGLIKIKTSSENSDGITTFCKEYNKGKFFDMFGNIDIIVKSSEVAEQ